jgi:spore coat protein U-like protein
MSFLRAAVAASLVALTGSASAVCTISTASGPAFGTYDILSSAPLDAVGTVSYRCTGGSRPTVQLSTGSSGTYLARTLRNGTSRLEYNLYLDAARSMVWGDGSAGTFTDFPQSGNRARSIFIYGRIPARQDPAVGSHSDSIVVTFVF